jgi:hypothetical protein
LAISSPQKRVRRIVTQRYQHPDAEAAHQVSGHAEDTDIFPNGIFGDRSV